MGGIFINYRRHPDRLTFVRTLHAQLAERFGAGNVFLDSASIGHGRRYPNQLRRHLDRSDVVIVVVHDGWAKELRADGADWVLNEIRWALAAGKTIIPMLLDGARMPRAHELPRPIREFANFQAHRTVDDDGHVRLATKIAEEPERRAAIGETPTRPWAGPLAVLLGIAAFAAPVLVLHSSERSSAINASVFGIAMLSVTMVAVVLVSLGRKPINEAERLAQDFDPTRYYLLVAAPAGIILVTMTVAIVFSSPVRPEERPLLVFVAGLAAMYLVFLVMRQYKLEKFREDNWPVRLKEPVKPAPVRRELERLVRRYRATGDLKRAQWHVHHLENAADVLARDASRGRWGWLTADHPVQLLVFTAWSATSVGLMTSAALPTMKLWIPALALVVTTATVWVTVEAGYRKQRWVRHRVADEVHAQVQRIQDSSPQPSA